MRVPLMAVALLAAGCSNPAGSPDALVGTWVGDEVGLLATAQSAEVSIPCQVITLSGPLAIRAGGTLDGAGTVTGSPKSLFNGRAARVSGTRDGAALVLNVEWYTDGNWVPVANGGLDPVPAGTDHRISASCIQ